jgi:multidrug resistance efflux pump
MRFFTKKTLILAILIFIVVTVVGCGDKKSKEVTAPVNKPVEENVINTIEAFGTVEIKEERTIGLDFSARVEDVRVVEGQKVSKGDVLLILSLTEMMENLENKKEALELAKKELESIKEKSDINIKDLQAELKTQESLYQQDKEKLARKEVELKEESSADIKKLLSEIEFAKRSYQKVKKELADKEHLLAVGAITQYEFDQFEKKYDNEEEKLVGLEISLEKLKEDKRDEIEELEKALELKENKIVSLKLSLKENRSMMEKDSLAKEIEIKNLESDIKVLEDKLFAKSYLKGNKVIVDIDQGVVHNLSVVDGDIIGSDYKDKLLDIMDLSTVIVEAEVPEEFIKDVKLGAEATIVPLADSNREYHGKVMRISNMAIKDGGETIVLVEISIDDYDDFLLPSFNVDVEIVK